MKRNKAVIDFNQRIVEFNKGHEPIRVDFKRVLDKARVTGVKMIQNRVGEGILETRVNVCQESESMGNDERVWENRAEIFFNEGGVVGSPQRQELSLIHI